MASIFEPFPPLTWDETHWTGSDILPSWAGCQTRRGPYLSRSSEEPSDGRVDLNVFQPDRGGDAVVDPSDRPQSNPTAEQLEAYAFLKTHEAAVASAVLKAIFDIYTSGLRDAYGYEDEDAKELMPEIESPHELKRLLGLGNVHVLGVAKAGVAYIGFEFGCAWDDEHGLGVLTHRDRIVSVGDAADSFLTWIAQEDAEKQR